MKYEDIYERYLNNEIDSILRNLREAFVEYYGEDNRNKIEKITGYKVGSIPPIGHELPCIFDDKLLNFNYVYAGTGDELITLKINPNDIKRLNKVISCLS